jgi:hypothetical protein
MQKGNGRNVTQKQLDSANARVESQTSIKDVLNFVGVSFSEAEISAVTILLNYILLKDKNVKDKCVFFS